MRIRTNRLYPYPILSPQSSDYGNSKFSVDCNLYYDSENATIDISTSIEDTSILELIKENRVGLFCHVDCSVTKYREVFEVYLDEKNNASIEMPLYKLNGSIEITCMLVAKDEIKDYTDSNFSGLYEGMTVTFPPFSTIGYCDTIDVVLNKSIDVNGEIPSIFTITQGLADCKEITYDTTSSVVRIYLPPEQYAIYRDYEGSSKRLKQMMINLPVLTELISEIQKDNTNYSEYGWYSVLEAAFEKNGIDGFDSDDFMNAEAIELSQKILGNLAKDAFDEFDKLNESNQ